MRTERLTPEEKREALETFLGYGNPNSAKVAIVGFEPGGVLWEGLIKSEDMDDEKKEQIAEKKMRKWLSCGKGDGFLRRKELHEAEDSTLLQGIKNGKSFEEEYRYRYKLGITERMAVLTSLRIQDEVFRDSWAKDLITKEKCIDNVTKKEMCFVEWYYFNEFCKDREITLNLYPIPAQAKSKDYDKFVRKYLGNKLKEEVWAHYRSDGSGRLSRIKDVIKAFRSRQDTIILFMGLLNEMSLFENEFQDLSLYKLGYRDKKEKQTKKAYVSGDGRVWFVQHPSYGWFDKVALDSLIQIVKDRNVFPPKSF